MKKEKPKVTTNTQSDSAPAKNFGMFERTVSRTAKIGIKISIK